MRLAVTYDISDNRTRTRVFKILESAESAGPSAGIESGGDRAATPVPASE